MLRVHLRRNITCLFWRNSPFTEKSHVAFSTSVLHHSTVGGTKSLKTTTVFEFLLHKHKFSPEVASHVDAVLNLAEIPKKCDSMLSYFKEIGFTKSELEKILKSRPHLLLASLEKTIKPKITIFQDLRFSSKDIISIISKDPCVLSYSAKNRVFPSLLLLRNLLGSYEKVAKAVRRSGWLLTKDLEKNMMPNVEFLKSCGVSMDQIFILFYHRPRLLLYKPEVMRKCVERVDQMGVDRSSRMFLYAVVSVGSMANGTWQLKLQAFRNILEFSDEDILRVMRQNPEAFEVSEDKIRKVKKFLIATGKFNTSSILRYPKALKYSIEKRYKPRFEVLATLERRNLIKEWPSLGILFNISDAKFFDVFVGPHLDDPVISALYKDHPMRKGGGKLSSAA